MAFSLLRKPVLTPEQLERLSNILDNAGQVALGVLVFTPLIQGFDKTNPLVLVLGAIDVAVCWTGSIVLSKRKDIEK